MFYSYHYIIYNPNINGLDDILLNDYGISSQWNTNMMGEKYALVFDVPGNHKRIDEILKFLPSETPNNTAVLPNQNCPSRQKVYIIYTPVFSEQERMNARWLSVRSTFGRIIPSNQNRLNHYECCVVFPKKGAPVGRHYIQAEPYVLASNLKWGRNYFASENTNEYRLFCNYTAKSIINSSELNGIEFSPVFRKRDNAQLDNVFQISTSNVLPNGSIVPLKDAVLYQCDICGMNMVRYTGGMPEYAICSNAMDPNIDLYYTLPLFLGRCDSRKSVGGKSCLILSQRMYRCLTKNKLDRNLIFTPLVEV